MKKTPFQPQGELQISSNALILCELCASVACNCFFQVDGNLSLHGITKPMHLVVDYFHCRTNMIAMKNVCSANATAIIKRSDFGVDKYAPALADDVKIVLQVEAIKD